ncbi:hypothetical protein [Streptomyces sp. NPDC050164]|uniref:hypothetical protein n=1 Tax=Streptomyces sp. NPDC050164 TaxID=3365605 RepID=UPI0037A1CD0A
MNPKAAAQVRSDACVLDELMSPYGSLDEARTRLVMRDNWASRWKRSRTGRSPTSEMQKIVENYPGRRPIIAAGSEKASPIRTGFAALAQSP